MRNFLSTLFVFFLFLAADAYAAESMRVAVMDLRPVSVSYETTKVISSMLRIQIIDSGKFTVVEREQMDMILKEQGLQMTGCTDAACAVEIGKMISARKILVGEVSKLGKAYIISCRIVDVEKGVAEFATQETSESDDELVPATRRMVVKLLKRMNISEASWVTEHSPCGIYLSYNQFLPLGKDLKKIYSTVYGGSAGYIYSFNSYLSFTGDINFLMNKAEENDDVILLMNSYSAGFRTGLYLHEKFYPYVGIALKGTYLREWDKFSCANYYGYGADAVGGFYIMFKEYVGIFLQYDYSWGKVNDKNKTDISGQLVSGGIIYKI